MENETKSTAADDLKFCFKILHQVSFNYAAAINQLDEPLRTRVCVFYLVLRALDTIEDDPSMENSIKEEALKIFPKYLDSPQVPLGIGVKLNCQSSNKNFVELMENFDKVLKVFGQFMDEDKTTIRDIVEEMAEGMTKYVEHSIETMADYDEYCYYVAGLVGIGLTKLIQSNCVLHQTCDDNNLKNLAISTGKILQKINIIRDVHVDISETRQQSFYPKEVWKKFVENDRDLIDENCQPQAIACVNVMINDAFQHIPDVVQYLALVPRKATFQFIAIPQVMAVATLGKMLNNPKVFRSDVKLSTAERLHIFENVTDMPSYLGIMKLYLSEFSTNVCSLNIFEDANNWILKSRNFVENYANVYYS